MYPDLEGRSISLKLWLQTQVRLKSENCDNRKTIFILFQYQLYDNEFFSVDLGEDLLTEYFMYSFGKPISNDYFVNYFSLVRERMKRVKNLIGHQQLCNISITWFGCLQMNESLGHR